MLTIKNQDRNSVRGLADHHVGELAFSGTDNEVLIGGQVTLNQVNIQFLGNHGRLEIEERCVIRGDIIIHAGATVRIGASTKMNKRCDIRVAANNQVNIGADCLLANVKFHAFESVVLINTVTKKRVNPVSPIVVGDRVWIAENCQLGCGAVIGPGAVIGANSMVMDSIAANSLAVGYPATAIKAGIRWTE